MIIVVVVDAGDIPQVHPKINATARYAIGFARYAMVRYK